MSTHAAAAAQSILSDSLSCLVTMICIQIFGVFRLFLNVKGNFSIRERFVVSLPPQLVVMVAFAVVFLVAHLGDMMLVGHAKPRVGTLHCNARSNERTGRAAFIAWNYIREARRPYSITDTSEEAAVAAEQYKQRIVIELKGALVWVLADVLGAGWLTRSPAVKRSWFVGWVLLQR
jgi:hypothetical protein